MKHAAKSFVIRAVVTTILSVNGCQHDPNPPTEEDAIAVWKNVHQKVGLENTTEWVSFKKTNGQMATVNGVSPFPDATIGHSGRDLLVLLRLPLNMRPCPMS